MKIIITLIKYGLPLLLIGDLGSEFFNSEMLLNISRAIRILLLFFFVVENIRLNYVIKNFYFYKLFIVFDAILFIYLFTDRDFIEGFWNYSKILYWTLGTNTFYAYFLYDKISLEDVFVLIKKIVLIAFIFTIVFLSTGFINNDYNLAAYLLLFMYPVVLYSSEGFKKNIFYIFLTALGIILTFKRGALLAFLISSIIYYVTENTVGFSFKKFIIGLFMIMSILFSGALIYINSENQERVMGRFSKEQFDVENDKAGSGRVGLYKNLYYEWKESDDIIVTLLGYGNEADSYRVQFRRTHAHSDILGFLYNHGLVGIVLILSIYIKMFGFYVKIRKIDSSDAINILVIFSVFLLVNIYSGLFRDTNTLYLMILLPFFQSKADRIKINYVK